MNAFRTRLLPVVALVAVGLASTPESARAQVLVPSETDAFEFRFVGPSNMSGRITAFSVPARHGGKTMHAAPSDPEVVWIGIDFSVSDPEIVYAVIQVSRSARRPDISPHGGVFRNEDGGVSWSRVHVDHHALWIDPDDSDHLVLGTDGGAYISWDRGETWEHQVIPAAQFYEVEADTTKVPYHVCGGMQDNGTWCGPNWTREEVGITDYDWEILGPDMTRGNRFAPEPDTGHTSYRSLHSVSESPLDADVTWTGSDDGLLWITTDGGETWSNVTENVPPVQAAPPGSPTRCFVGEIEASHHDTATAYVAYDCHRRDDYRPYVFRTGELMVGTYSRSVYVTDIHPLQQLSDEVLSADLHFFQPRSARQYRERDTYGSFGDDFFRTPNPEYGAALWYRLAEDTDEDAELEITRIEAGSDTVDIRTLSGSGEAGMHRVQWDLTRNEPRPRSLNAPASESERSRVLPGTYTVTRRVGGETRTREVVVEEGWVERVPGRMR